MPKMRYLIHGDEQIAADSPQQLVEFLANSSMVPVASPAAFRMRAAHYGQLLYGAEIRTGSDEEFVQDMLRHGFYKELGPAQ